MINLQHKLFALISHREIWTFIVAVDVDFLLTCKPFNLEEPDKLQIREFDFATGRRLASGRRIGQQAAVSYLGKASADIKRMIVVTVRFPFRIIIFLTCCSQP